MNPSLPSPQTTNLRALGLRGVALLALAPLDLGGVLLLLQDTHLLLVEFLRAWECCVVEIVLAS